MKVARLMRPVTHADLDAIGTARSTSQVRSLLVQLDVLEERDEYATAFHTLAAKEIATLSHRSDQLALRQFIHWHQQRRSRERQLTLAQSANDRNELRVLISLIRALNARDATIATARQEHLDEWGSVTASAFRSRRFLTWCARTGTNRDLAPPPSRRADFQLGGSLSAANEGALRSVLADETHSPRMRLAVLLAVVYAVRVHRIAELRHDALQVTNHRATVRLGSADLDLPPIAARWITQLRNGVPIRHRVGGDKTDDTWVFPGYRHRNHMLPSSLSAKLKAIGVSPQSAHQSSVAAIITQVPPTVVARLLGVSVSTASSWYAVAGTSVQHR